MRDPDHYNHKILVVDRVENSVPPLPDPVLLLSGQLLATSRPWVGCQPIDPRHDFSPILPWQDFDLFRGRRFDE
jgi:hypothetical protein